MPGRAELQLNLLGRSPLRAAAIVRRFRAVVGMPLALVCTCFCRGAFASMGDHDIPTPEGESNELAGYHMMGRLFAVGCMRGLLDATRSPWR